jgi:hypothetical protein
MQSQSSYSTPCCWNDTSLNGNKTGYCVCCYGESNSSINTVKYKYKWMCIPFIWFYSIGGYEGAGTEEEQKCIGCWWKSRITTKTVITTTESFGCCFTKTTVQNATTGQSK